MDHWGNSRICSRPPKPDLPPKPHIKKVEADSDEELSNHMSKLSINKAISRQVKKEIKKTSQRRCSNCNRTGHNSRKCSRKKKSRSKKKGKVNLATVDSDSESGVSSSDNDSNSGSESESDSEI